MLPGVETFADELIVHVIACGPRRPPSKRRCATYPVGVRDAYYEAEAAGVRAIWRIVLNEIDRTQDSEGVVDQVLDLLQEDRANTEAAAV